MGGGMTMSMEEEMAMMMGGMQMGGEGMGGGSGGMHGMSMEEEMAMMGMMPPIMKMAALADMKNASLAAIKLFAAIDRTPEIDNLDESSGEKLSSVTGLIEVKDVRELRRHVQRAVVSGVGSCSAREGVWRHGKRVDAQNANLHRLG